MYIWFVFFCIHKRPNGCTYPQVYDQSKKSKAEEKFKILKKINNLQIKNRRIRENVFFYYSKMYQTEMKYSLFLETKNSKPVEGQILYC